MSISTLVKELIRVIRQDVLILIPMILDAFLVLWHSRFLVNQEAQPSLVVSSGLDTMFSALLFVVHIFLVGVTMAMVVNGFSGKKIDVFEVIKIVKQRYMRLLIVYTILILPLLILLGLIMLSVISANIEENVMIWTLMMMVLLVLSLFLMFAPVFVLVEDEGWSQAIKHSIHYVKTFWKTVFIFVALTMAIYFVGVFIEALLMLIPIVGEDVFATIINGIFQGLVTILLVLFYLKYVQIEFKGKGSVDVLINSNSGGNEL